MVSRGNFAASKASSSSSWTSPWSCCEPCSARRFRSSICFCMAVMVWSFSITLSLSSSSASFFAFSRSVLRSAWTLFSIVRSSSRLASSSSRCLRIRSAWAFCASASFASFCFKISWRLLTSLIFWSSSLPSASFAFRASSATMRPRSMAIFWATCCSSVCLAFSRDCARSVSACSRCAISLSFCVRRCS